ncbi:unnamed protein product [Phytophthora fragariaefolia]|uniref:Unnamed protein product n=1 Tax=Phytophthora fragariaefolia TaxID=1490495 RepID=A0A9W6X694_9STRA|nr:unnamed protein product [Phytophthora fragariaefolia]
MDACSDRKPSRRQLAGHSGIGKERIKSTSAPTKQTWINHVGDLERESWAPQCASSASCEGIFLGYEERSKAYRVYDIEAGQVVISRDVTFDESSFDGSKGIDDEDVDGVTDYFDDMQVSDDSGT